MKIGFLGCGNMGKAIIRGALNAKVVSHNDMYVFDIFAPAMVAIAEDLGVKTGQSPADIVKQADIIIIAVKPKDVPGVLEAIAPYTEGKVILSIAAGVSIERIVAKLGASAKIVRAMPNTPALVGEGMTAIAANANVTEAEKKEILAIFNCFGKAEMMGEYLFDAVTGLSGSGPAYAYIFIEAMADGAVLCGMPRETAYRFAAQTLLGSARMVLESGQHPGALKDMVCSPAGTTIEAVQILEKKGFRSAVIDAVQAATAKSAKM